MNVYEWILALAVAVAIVFSGVSYIPGFQRLLAHRLARRVGLGVPDALDREIRVRAASRERTGVFGYLLAMALVYGVLRLNGEPIGQFSTYLCLAGGFLGNGFGTGIASFISETRRRDTPIRLARLRVVRPRDYLPGILGTLGWIVFCCWAAALGAQLIFTPAGAAPSALRTGLIISVAMVGFGGLGLVFFEFASRLIVRRGQPAGSTDELVWDDALRSSALRDLLNGPLLAVVYASLAGVAFSALAATHSVPGNIAVVVLGIAGALALIGYLYLMRHTQQWYLEILWHGSRRRTAEESAQLAAASSGAEK